MKLLLFVASLTVSPLALWAQKVEPSASPRTYLVGAEKAPLYQTPRDTVNQFPLFLPANTKVVTVGEYNARWMKVELKGHYFLMPTRLLADYTPKTPKVVDNDAAPTLPVDPQSHLVDYSAVVEVPSASQSQLYTRAYEWASKNYPLIGTALLDKEKGRITVQGTTHPHYQGNEFGVVTHTFTVYTKEGKYKYDFTNFRHDFKGAGSTGGDASLGPFENETPRKMVVGTGMLHRVWNSIRNDTDTQIKTLIADLDKYMQGQYKDKSDF